MWFPFWFSFKMGGLKKGNHSRVALFPALRSVSSASQDPQSTVAPTPSTSALDNYTLEDNSPGASGARGSRRFFLSVGHDLKVQMGFWGAPHGGFVVGVPQESHTLKKSHTCFELRIRPEL